MWLWMCPDVDVAAPDAATCAPCVRACACQHCKCSATSPYSICSSLSCSLSLSLFPSASAVAYLPLRRSRLSLTKPHRDAAERGGAGHSSSTPAKHLRPFPHNIYPASFFLPSSCSNSWRSSASICRLRLRLRLRLFLYTHHAAPARPV